MPRRIGLAALLSTALVLTACSDGAGPRLTASPPPDSSPSSSAPSATSAAPSAPSIGTNPPPQAAPAPAPLVWTGCRDGFECAELPVPLDYSAPRGSKISLAVIRIKARDRTSRVGSLVVNPGGPGVSAVEFLRSFATGSVPAELRKRFDLVAFDPRGTTGSAPVRCLDTPGLDRFFHVDPDPDSSQEVTDLEQANRTFAAGCRSRSGRVLPHVSTEVAARDMDRVRAALREPRLTYLGYSYGTSLGASYLELFPTRVRAMVLDGALDPRLSWDQVLTGQGNGFEQAFRSFLRWCDRNASSCAFRAQTEGDLATAYDRIAARVETDPLPGSGRRTVGPGELSYGAGQALYSTSFWPFLGTALAEAAKGQGAKLLTLSDSYLERTDRGYANTIEANFAVNCLDRPWPRDLASYQRLAEQLERTAPRFGPAIAWSGSGCAVWPVPPTGKPRAVRATGAPAVVVIGTTRDPATPYQWSQGLAGQLDKGVLMTFDGDGHTAYRRGASACLARPVTAYLLTGEAPAPKRC